MSDKKMKRDDLGNRMKTFYEEIPKTKLMRRCPVICRLDGKAFHTFTRGFKRPFDDVLIKTMQETAKYLCENIQGCQLAYTESDEISLLLIDYQRFETSAWFDYEIQKMCSISASMATMAFNKFFEVFIKEENYIFSDEMLENGDYNPNYKNKELFNIWTVHKQAAKKGAMFDARVFNIPREEVTNYFYWRQLDASRNSIQMVGQVNFSHKELQNKSCNDIQDMLMTQKGINWNDFPTYQKRGSCVVKENYLDATPESTDSESIRNRWIIDRDIPIFKGEGREYIERFVNVGEV
jgi:tRNA(His) 5'-end guanylyltransferase